MTDLQRIPHFEAKGQEMLNPVKGPSARRANNMCGVTLMELVVVLFIIVVLMGIALPSIMGIIKSYRGKGDARKISGELALTRMRAAADFTQTRLFVNLTANTYRIDIWNKTGNTTYPTGCWQTEAATASAPCDATTSASSTIAADISLTGNSTMGFGAASSAPPSTQTTFGQASNCLNNSGSVIANTACITFNSRGIPVTPGNPLTGVSNTPTANDAIYFTNQAGLTYAVTVLPTGKTTVWAYSSSAWTQQ
jgi:Tfp pilus assembly protein FimT